MTLVEIITAVTSGAALIISIFSWRAALHADRTANFDRRYAVYMDANDFIAAWGRDGAPDRRLLGRLIDAWSRSHFLFAPEITAYLRELWVDSVDAEYTCKVVAGEFDGDHSKAVDKKYALMRKHVDPDQLRRRFLPHLQLYSERRGFWRRFWERL